MAFYTTVCVECWECEQNCKQIIDNVPNSGNTGFKKWNCKEIQAMSVKAGGLPQPPKIDAGNRFA